MSTARSIYEGAIDFDRQDGSEVGLVIALHRLGELEEGQGNYTRARALYQELLDRRREIKAIRPGNPH